MVLRWAGEKFLEAAKEKFLIRYEQGVSDGQAGDS
jgi:hypothetical protein